ncbi:MAG TPA: bifunctional DNA-formamidopyrimidine glycosylase/DNA-(apurinic or apyrimidinic site) lyase [Candidatus Saccharimonadales bacterium]|nr:bifunctional DNA-formamidopyrimidine glycosylase/DNA-(apurinic or apyrimidinic site) lyase [Candidatus Saccharimonadales bacterium]
MPELPEVETVARDLRGAVTGRRIDGVTVLRPDIVRYPDGTMLPALLTGQTFGEVERHGKYLFLGLDSGDDLMVHLGMTGHLLVCDAGAPVPKHTHIRASLDDGRELRFDDARRFGRVAYGSREALIAARVFPRLGVEPLSTDFSQDRLDTVLKRTTRTVKAALLDQQGVAGLGNIYIDEACFLAGVRPTKRCNRLTKRQRAALLDAIPRVLSAAVANRGSSVDDYRDVWNARGTNQERLQVYGRGGQPCFQCGAMLRRTQNAGRTTVYCSTCQR